MVVFQEAQPQGQNSEQGTHDSRCVLGAVEVIPDGPQEKQAAKDVHGKVSVFVNVDGVGRR